MSEIKQLIIQYQGGLKYLEDTLKVDDSDITKEKIFLYRKFIKDLEGIDEEILPAAISLLI